MVNIKKNLSPLGIYLSFIGKYSSDTRAYCPEPAGFLFKNKIIPSLINNRPMLIELLNHCLDC